MLGKMLFDPRLGDAEDDGSSPKRRSLLAIAGSLLVEISLPKLALAWTVSILLPAALLGSAPLVATIWFAKVSRIAAELTELGAVLMLVAIVGLGWIGWRPLWRTAEMNFWSLNALAVQPGYTFCREALRHLAEHLFNGNFGVAAPGHLRAISAASSAVILCVCGLLIAIVTWPASHWAGTMTDLLSLHSLVLSALANAVVVVSAYFAIASLIWGVADARMDQPIDLAAFAATPAGPVWRIAHLSDIHMVGEHYGFRIESGRSGPRGNGRVVRIMARLEAIHNDRPLDLVLVSGDMTDAGRASEWAEFIDVVTHYPVLAQRMIILPGNHDLNIVDRLNPARLDLPFSPGKRLRQMRILSAIAAVQGDRVRVVDARSGKLEHTLAQALAPHRQRIADFADSGSLRLSWTRASLGQSVSDDHAAHNGGRDRRCNPQLQCRNSFLLHQCAGNGFCRTGAQVSGSGWPFCASAVDRRAASSSRGISDVGGGVLRTHRNCAGQRELVRTPPEVHRLTHGCHARPPPHRLDRHLRQIENHIGTVTGDGREERHADIFSYPHADIRRGRATLLASAGTRRDCRRERALLN